MLRDVLLPEHAATQIQRSRVRLEKETLMRPTNGIAALFFILIFGAGAGAAVAMYNASPTWPSYVVGGVAFLLAAIVASSIKIANQWDKAVVLRMGRFEALRGPGLFFIVPIVDSIVYWIDTRVITMSFNAEKTLTKDTVPVDVDAVLFWKVLDPQKAALDVADYQTAIGWACRPHFATSSARPCLQTCWKAGT